jgi:Ca2+-binding RTX toxin-like protein
MFEAFEGRRLMAASAALDGSTLKVLGTDESESIRIFTGVEVSPENKKKLTIYYSVLVNDQVVGRFDDSVRRIHIFGLGGRDRITGAITPGNQFIDPRTGARLVGFPEESNYPAPTYIEGGSGSDIIMGGLGNDTIKGGRGDDAIGDLYARNYLDGGSGNDLVSAFAVRKQDVPGQPSYYNVGSGRNRITAGAGADTVGSLNGDTLLDTPEESLFYAI